MKKILIIKNGVCDVDKTLQHIIHDINKNSNKIIQTYIMKSYDLVRLCEPKDCFLYDAIIICGGNQSLVGRHDDDYPYEYLNKLIEYTKIWIDSTNICILGICLGAQIIGEACGFKTARLDFPVIGYQNDIRLCCSTTSIFMDESFIRLHTIFYELSL